MQLPFFNGLIWGTLIGGAGLVVLSLSHDVLNLKGLNPEVTVLPISQSPDTAMTAQVPVLIWIPPRNYQRRAPSCRKAPPPPALAAA